MTISLLPVMTIDQNVKVVHLFFLACIYRLEYGIFLLKYAHKPQPNSLNPKQTFQYFPCGKKKIMQFQLPRHVVSYINNSI